MALYGVGLEMTVKKLNYEYLLTIKKKGGNGLKILAAIFRQYDFKGTGKLDMEDFGAALAQYGFV